MKTLAIDIDDTLADFSSEFARYSNQTWGTDLTKHDYDEDWSKLWVVDSEEFHTRSHAVIHSGFQAKLTNDPGARSVLEHLKKSYRLIILTSRPNVLKDITITWVNTHFPNVFDEICFSGLWDDASQYHTAHTLTKAEACVKYSVDYLIDDQPKHCVAAVEVGKNAVLFGDYSWSTSHELPDGVVRAHTWKDVQDYFDILETQE